MSIFFDKSMNTHNKARKLFDPPIVKRALADSVRKLTPAHQVKNPVMFVVWVGSILTTLLIFVGEPGIRAGFIAAVSVWLWFTVIFANFAEAMAEGRGKAQADTLRRARRDTPAKKLDIPVYGSSYKVVSAATLRKGPEPHEELQQFLSAAAAKRLGLIVYVSRS